MSALRIARLSLPLLVAAIGASVLPGCAAPTDGEESGGSESAISGDVSVGTIVTTTTALRFRRTPSQASSANILGVLPSGTELMVTRSFATSGFYQVRIQDAALGAKLKVRDGWVFGAYLKGDEVEPGVTEPNDPAKPGAPDPGTDPADPGADPGTGPTTTNRTFRANFRSGNCRPVRDDNGAFMVPTLDDYVINAGGNVMHVAMGIDSDELPNGALVRVAEVDAKPAVAAKGRSVLFKVVKTGTGPSPTGVSTVTLCSMASGLLPAAGTAVTVKVIAE